MKDLENKILDTASHLQMEDNKTQDQIWNELHSKLQSNKSKRKPKSKILYLTFAAAASVIIGFFILNSLINETIIHQTTIADYKTVKLPNGSEVILSPDSELAVFEKNWKNKRELTLKGEALFNVTKGVPFVVNFESGKVKVLGTSFRIKARGEIQSVNCSEGKIEISNNKSSVKKILTRGEKALFADKKPITISRFDIKSEIMRQNGKFSFNKATLKEVSEEFYRQFGYQITSDEPTMKRRYSGSFINKNMELALEFICVPMQLKFKIDKPKKIVTVTSN